ncbi:MarR family transcriptional regulator [Amycolatopsis pigmentata]|uniref:MarR family transcriptional regulator n=1 Tax=Amycolatopsis pigmentata TaxID=450801 RepID=A0ABW5FM44_9PSEU
MSTQTRTQKSPTARKLQPFPQSAGTPTGRTEAEAKLWEALRANPNSTATGLASAASIGKSTAGKILAKWANQGNATRTPGIFEGGQRTADRWVIADDQHEEMDISKAERARTDARTDTEAKTISTTTPATATDPSHGKSADIPTANAEVAEVDTTAPVTADPSGDKTAEQHQSGNSAATDNNTREKAPRLAPGALRGMVEDYLRDHPTEEFGPAAIGKALDRSSGAVANALSLLTERGVAVQTSQAPRRYRIAASG